MKIVHVVEPLSGGIVTFLKSLVKNLPDDSHIIIHGERKREMPVSEVKKQFTSTNVKFIRWKSAQRSLRFKEDLLASAELFTILKRLKENGSMDIVHLHSSKGGFIGRVVCRMLGVQHRVVYTPNGAPFLGNESRLSNYIYKKLEKLATGFGGQVVCCSLSEQKAYKSAGINGLMINNGIEHKKNTGNTERLQKDKVFRIVTSGRIENQKNPVMFNSIATYFEEFGQFEFLWVGDGTERNLLTAKNIQVTGWLGQAELDTIVTNADLYLSTAHFEGLPFSVLEALAHKKPVLLTDCVGNKDLVMKGLNGGVFQTQSEAIHKILQFYNNTSMLSIMGEHSSTHCIAEFNQKDTYSGYKNLYRKIAFKRLDHLYLKQLAHGIS